MRGEETPFYAQAKRGFLPPQATHPPTAHHTNKRKKPFARGAAKGFRAIFGSGLLSHMTLCSIIGDGELNFRVRNGVGCTLSSMATKEISGHLLKCDCVARRFALGHGRLCPFPSLSTCAPCHISKSALKYDMQSRRCVVKYID